ncbi:MAG: 4Fe-4S dicluster domain-containing protein [Chloroflexota bacterium]|nr:4Fe-4S dicluster domain-containing protein [Chloroflexota bacterium]
MKKINPRKTDFIEKVNEISGQNIGQCFQCGTCSGSCPNADDVDILPRQLIRRAQLGLEQSVLESKIPWVCASCLSCTVHCPRGIDLARVMEAVRLLKLRDNIDYVKLNELSQETIEELPQIALISSFRKHTA